MAMSWQGLGLVVLCMLGAGAARAEPVVGRVEAGARLNASCIGCHGIDGYRASFPQIYRVPKIGGQSAAYLSAALQAYRQGDRKHPTMRAVAGSLSDQDIADLAAFYAAQGRPAAVAAAPVTLPADLKDKLTACTACHGANFDAPTDPANPRLAGQHADYLAVALKAYRHQGQALIGRGNPTMVGMAATLTEAEVSRVADYLASLPGSVHTPPERLLR